MHKVVATGVGVIAPNGSSIEPFWEGLLSGRTVSGAPTAIADSNIRVAEVLDNSFLNTLPVKAAALDRSAQLAVSAAGEALAMAGIDCHGVNPARVAVIIGNGGAGLVTLDEQFARLYRDGHLRAHPMAIAKSMSSSTASWVSIAFGFRGQTFVIASACASGTHAIGIAQGMVRSGLVDVAIAGGAEAPLTEGTIRAWDSMRILSPDLCRPFSANRKGLLLGEGAGIVVMESEAHALSRGAKVLSTVAGFSCCADAGDLFNPSREGMARVMTEALADGGLSKADIGYINAHGTGTMANDQVETEALKDVFGFETCPPVSSIKSITGHSLGASGGVEAVATILSLSRGFLPPTANYDAPDPVCDLDYIPNMPRQVQVQAAMSNSFAFGGLNASLVFTH